MTTAKLDSIQAGYKER